MGGGAITVRLVGQAQQLTDRGHVEAQFARMPDEAEPPQFRLTINPVATFRAHRRRQQALALVPADGGRLYAGRARQRADGIMRHGCDLGA